MFDLKSIRTKEDNSPKYYVLEDKGLEVAVQMAIWLGKPLLLTGAPGTGKTQLAYKVADILASKDNINSEKVCAFIKEPLVFNTKTTSASTDLFYYYDAVRHFQRRYVDDQDRLKISASVTQKIKDTDQHDAGTLTIKNETSESALTAHSFIKLNALGKAILQAWGKDAIIANEKLCDLQWLAEFDEMDSKPRSSVVLIDEIDKAPRDFPNDLLFEIENTAFSISELMNKNIPRPDTNAQIVVIMTSNFEKNLPDAFLRRCLFYHIAFPGTDGLMKIVSSRIQPHLQELYKADEMQLNNVSTSINKNLNAVVKKFEEIRTAVKEKQPATAELLEWVKVLEKQGFFNAPLDFSNLTSEQKEIFRLTLPALAKSDEDLNMLKKKYS